MKRREAGRPSGSGRGRLTAAEGFGNADKFLTIL